MINLLKLFQFKRPLKQDLPEVVYFDSFKEELFALREYLSVEKMASNLSTHTTKYNEYIKTVDLWNYFVIPRPELPWDIEQRILLSRERALKEKAEINEIYGFNKENVCIITIDDLEEDLSICGRSDERIFFDGDRLRRHYERLKKEKMFSIEHHIHVNDSWPSSTDLSTLYALSDCIDLSIVSRANLGSAFIDVKRFVEKYEELKVIYPRLFSIENHGLRKFYSQPGLTVDFN